MRRYFQSWSSLLWVALLALLVVRAGDAHLHLCLDGQSQQRSSVHVSDTSVVCDENEAAEGEHQDKDVNVFGAALAKKSADADVLDLPAILPVILLLLPPERGIVHYAATRDPEPKLPYLFLPLLRGPPA